MEINQIVGYGLAVLVGMTLGVTEKRIWLFPSGKELS